jgi:cyclic beta-1,2-glucan synthetase
VVANKNFGFLITESGGGYTWSDNSRENRLTPWTNDPVSDRGGEVVYIRNTATGHFFSATPLPAPGTGAYEVTHGFGYSTFRTESEKIRSTLLISGAAEGKVKWWSVKVTNLSEVSVELESYLHLDLVLGITRQESYRHIVTDFESSGQFLYGINRYNNEFAGSVVFAGCSRELTSYTADRLDFVGRHRDLSSPVALENVSFTSASSLENPVLTGLSTIMGIGKSAPRLSKSVGAGLDPCFTLVTTLILQPGEEKEVVFYLGEAPSLGDAKAVAKQAQQPRAQASELDQVRHRYSEQCSQFEIKTPDRSFDLLMNGWLLYQTLSCRINGRSALYQSGGAFGFRDQLQDVLALIYANPAMVREQIVLHASRQFVEGDVQHWWHPPTGRGVRTRISDDYLWLPYVVHRYIEITGDYSVLEVEAPYIDARHLEEHEMEAYLVPSPSQQSGTILHHCLAALNRSLNFGPHGLPLIGGGDWNDGMNEVGREGRGESVWLGWFLAELLKNFSEILEPRNEHTLARRYREYSAQLVRAIEEQAWDGAWYRRAYFDDGTPLGSAAGEECQIDSLAQTWSVITGLGNEHRQQEAMEAVYERLVDSNHRIIKLLTPPFNTMKKDPGYIKGYLPGIRENGGQYTHAATWVVLATAKLGRGKLAYDLFSMLNPITHTTSPEGVTRYKGEPYVLCGDVYSVAPYEGHAGWSWYTGSSGWLFRVGLEGILGFTLHSGTAFTIDPCVPPSWSEFTLRFTLRGSRYEVKVLNPTGVERGVKEIHLDGKTVSEARIPVQENRKELTTVKVVMG